MKSLARRLLERLQKDNLVSFLEGQFKIFNRLYFDNKLTQIPIKEHTASESRKSGVAWLAHKGLDLVEYDFDKRLIKNKEIAKVVLLHEMCHQAELEIDKTHSKALYGDSDDRNDQLHSESWKKWMRKVGLTPPEKYQRFFGTKLNNIEDMSVEDFFNKNEENRLEFNKAKEDIKKRIELNKEYAKDLVLKEMNPILSKLAKDNNMKIDDLIDIQKKLMEEDFKQYVRRSKKFIDDSLYDKIMLGINRNWNLVMFNDVEKQLQSES